MAEVKLYVIRDEHIRGNAAEYVSTLECDDKKPLEVVVRLHKKRRTDPQLRTLWMWHTEVASELTVRTSKRWIRDDVHEVIFKQRFMPSEQADLPDGTTVTRVMGTSHPEVSREQITDAMDGYLAWCYDMGIEVTVPDPMRAA